MSVTNKSHGIGVKGKAIFNITDTISLDGGVQSDTGMQYPDEGENRKKRDNFLRCFIGKAGIEVSPSEGRFIDSTSQ